MRAAEGEVSGPGRRPPCGPRWKGVVVEPCTDQYVGTLDHHTACRPGHRPLTGRTCARRQDPDLTERIQQGCRANLGPPPAPRPHPPFALVNRSMWDDTGNAKPRKEGHIGTFVGFMVISVVLNDHFTHHPTPVFPAWLTSMKTTSSSDPTRASMGTPVEPPEGDHHDAHSACYPAPSDLGAQLGICGQRARTGAAGIPVPPLRVELPSAGRLRPPVPGLSEVARTTVPPG